MDPSTSEPIPSGSSSAPESTATPFPREAPKSTRIYRGGDNRLPAQTFAAPATATGEYPGDWFLEHVGQKPELVIPDYRTKITADGVADLIARQGTNNPLNADLVVYMIAEVMKTLVATNVTKWESFGTLIAPQGKNVNPLDLFDTKYVAVSSEASIGTPNKPPTATAISLMYLVFTPIRIDTTHQDYKEKLVTRMTAAMVSMRMPHNLSPTNFATGYANLKNNGTYLKLAAGLDMFLHRFPGSEHAKLRVGTIVSRFRDCSALKTLVYFSRIMGVNDEQLLGWVWNRHVAQEIERVMDYRSEINNEFGYGPYFSFMKLGSKSATSMTLNPSLHVYVHTIGIVLGHSRSMNAVMPPDTNFHPLMRTGLAIGFAISGSGSVAQEFGAAGAAMVDLDNYEDPQLEAGLIEEADFEDQAVEEERPPTAADYNEWIHYYGRNRDQYIFEKHVYKAAKIIHQRANNYRANTVGQALAVYAASIFEAGPPQ